MVSVFTVHITEEERYTLNGVFTTLEVVGGGDETYMT